MIHKVYIVRCSYCHAPLHDRMVADYRPKYFYTLDGILQALSDANWKVINGMDLCDKCHTKYGSYSEL